jgi:periplasmic protein TonB
MARRMGDEGEVRLDILVSAEGAVLEVKLKRTSGSELLDRAAVDAVKRWRFRPAQVDGKPTAEWYYNWSWVFKLDS